MTPDATPDRGPDATPDRMPDATSDRMPDATSDRMPDAPRALTSREHALIAAMLGHAGYSTTCLADLTAVAECTCGTCPSIELAHRGVRTPQTISPTRIIDATTADSLVSLLMQDDIPTYLEIAPFTDDPVALPSPTDLAYLDED